MFYHVIDRLLKSQVYVLTEIHGKLFLFGKTTCVIQNQYSRASAYVEVFLHVLDHPSHRIIARINAHTTSFMVDTAPLLMPAIVPSCSCVSFVMHTPV